MSLYEPADVAVICISQCTFAGLFLHAIKLQRHSCIFEFAYDKIIEIVVDSFLIIISKGGIHMATPHNRAEKGEIAKTVLMPGDPLRAKWIAETYLEKPELVSDVRNIYCYTGKYRGKPLSVMASGMGMPSMGIYSYELYKFYDVDTIIRIGSAGAYTEKLNLMDVVLADAVWSESTYGRAQSLDTSPWQYPSKALNETILSVADSTGKKLIAGRVHSSDAFYHETEANKVLHKMIQKEGLICVEMESFALFHNAALLGKQVACLLTISDSLVTGEELDASARQLAFSDMVEMALNAAAAI